MAKHEFAQYRRDDGTVVRIYPSELHDLGKLTRARSEDLWCKDFDVRLFPRYRKDAPHFYTSSPKRCFDDRKEVDPAHDKRRDKLIEKLERCNYRIGTRVRDNDGVWNFETITTTENYCWGKEVTRILTKEIGCRHDIFGESRDRNLVASLPWVAIEVIKTHYPDELRLQGMIALSAQLPFIVLFDMVDAYNYYFKIDEESRIIRAIYYIKDGAVWKNGRRWKGCSSEFFRAKIEEDIDTVNTGSFG